MLDFRGWLFCCNTANTFFVRCNKLTTFSDIKNLYNLFQNTSHAPITFFVYLLFLFVFLGQKDIVVQEI